PGSLWHLAPRADLRARLGPRSGGTGVGALQHRPVALGSALWLDVGRYRSLGVGALPLWSLGRRRWFLGVGAGARRGPARVLSRSRRVLRRPRDRGERRRARGQLGRAQLGRARGAMVGPGRLRGQT